MPKFSYRDSNLHDFHWYTLTSHGILFLGNYLPNPQTRTAAKKLSQWRVGFAVWPGWGFAVWPGWGFAVWPGWVLRYCVIAWPGWPAGFLRQFAVARLAGWVFAAIKVARPGWGFAVAGWVLRWPGCFFNSILCV